MWLQTNIGFFSVVEHRENPDLVLIRARAREDLENLCEQAAEAAEGFDDRFIIEDRLADYQWRLIAPRDAWVQVLTNLTNDIDYDNFKTAVGEKNKDRASLYLNIWTILRRIQYPESDSSYHGMPHLWSEEAEPDPDWPDDPRWKTPRLPLT